MAWLCKYPPLQAGSYEVVISEACLWAEVLEAPAKLRASKVDFVLCTDAQARRRDFKHALCIYIDGQQHFPWWNTRATADRQAHVHWQRALDTHRGDRLITEAAVAQGYCVVRVCFQDVGNFLSIVKAAWAVRTQSAVHVSRSWSTGAHLERRLVAVAA